MRLIDAEPILMRWNTEILGRIEMYDIVKNAPVVDTVSVVRCKDCRYYQDNNGGYPNADCKWCKDETPDANDYCSCGERKDDETDRR